jgi:hypothetical protein
VALPISRAERTTTLTMAIAEGRAVVVVVHYRGWRFRFVVDADAPAGLIRDLESTVMAIAA